ncbi:MAG: hypothetical protein ACOC7R_00260 [Planctomycetota bacterium]
MTTADDLIRRAHWARAAAGPGGTLQPAPPPAPPLRWMKAAAHWINAPANGSYVRAHPCADATGTDADTEVMLKVALPRTPGTDPNVVADQVIGCLAAADGALVAVTGYLDDAIGTIRLWALDADPPEGWSECIPGGTPGHGAPRVEHLKGAFPVGRDVDHGEMNTVDEAGGTTSHCHTLRRDNEPECCSVIQIDEGTWNSVTLGLSGSAHLPPYCVVRFIERVDNSLTV